MSAMEVRETMMRRALLEAEAALEENEVPVGCLIADQDGKVLACAHNRMEQLCDPTAHAELMAISAAAKLRGGRLAGCTLYVSLEPCAMCAGAAINSKLSRIVFGAYDPLSGCCGSVAEITDHWFSHTVEVWGGVCREECEAQLKRFFKERR